MKSIHSPYSTQSHYYYLFLHALFIANQKNPKSKLPIYLLNRCGYDTCWYYYTPMRLLEIDCWETVITKTHEYVYSKMDDRLEDMIHDVGIQTFAKIVYENMTTNVENLLYPSSNFTQLSLVLRLINLKALNG